MQPVIYRCPKECPIHKQCFVLKSAAQIEEPIHVLQKCPAEHNNDILITIGGQRPP